MASRLRIRSWAPPLVPLLLLTATFSLVPSRAQRSDVASTVHNLSVSGPGEVRALTETEICKFCHIPHSAVVPEPLWGHRLSDAPSYEVAEVRGPGGLRAPAPQPDGSSRLCLSCHDGTIALGDVAGEPAPIAMLGSSVLGPGRPGFLGTDLSGSHPISFIVPDMASIPEVQDTDMGLRPLDLILEEPDVKLDDQGKMQCTTCHDPHADTYYQPGVVPRFWVKPTIEEVCLTCHVLR